MKIEKKKVGKAKKWQGEKRLQAQLREPLSLDSRCEYMAS